MSDRPIGQETDRRLYGDDYSVYTMRQASRRSWCIGQTQPVQVVFMAYRNTLQADALKLVAKKLQSSLALEGELPGDGLDAYGDDGEDLMLALARKIVAGEEDADSVFAQAQQVAAEAEALLVDVEWRPPEPLEAEVVVAATGAGDRLDDNPEPQRSLFSWAEFMAKEPGEPPKRQHRDEAPMLSLFEWALEREQHGALASASGLTAGDRGGRRVKPRPSPVLRCAALRAFQDRSRTPPPGQPQRSPSARRSSTRVDMG